MRTCRDCKQDLPLEAFQKYWHKNVQDYRYTLRCKPCRGTHRRGRRDGYDKRNAKRNELYRTDAEYRAEIKRRGSIYRYGVDIEELLAGQGGLCALCGTDDALGKGWMVDHDHKCCPGTKTCGKCTRGVLCAPCNLGLGQFGDDANRLMSAAAYLLQNENLLAGLTGSGQPNLAAAVSRRPAAA